MLVTIWRHGEAGAAATDRERQLTPHGREDVTRGAARFVLHCEAGGFALPGTVHYSPWLRTTQTAEILAAGVCDHRSMALKALQPGSDTDRVDAELCALGAELDFEGHVLLVSHQPLVSYLADYYLGARGLVPALPPGGQVTLAMDYPAQGGASLKFWAFPPDYERSC